LLTTTTMIVMLAAVAAMAIARTVTAKWHYDRSYD
jgi:hypothetical protein